VRMVANDELEIICKERAFVRFKMFSHNLFRDVERKHENLSDNTHFGP
jgi:hypothetical protein